MVSPYFNQGYAETRQFAMLLNQNGKGFWIILYIAVIFVLLQISMAAFMIFRKKKKGATTTKKAEKEVA